MSQQQLRSTYNGLKSDFTTTQQNAQIRLQAQQKLNATHFEKSMQKLEEQFAEAERQRKLQQQLLKQHYEHQKYLMKKRHNELLIIKDKLKDVNSHEQHQLHIEQHLQQKHQRLLDIQRDYQMRSEKTQSQRELLESRKKTILDEMKEFDALTQSMGQLNLQGNLTEEQKQQIEEFVRKHPESMRNLDHEPPQILSRMYDDDFHDDPYDDDYNFGYDKYSRRRRSRSQCRVRRHSRRRPSKRSYTKFTKRSHSPPMSRRRSSRQRRRKSRYSEEEEDEEKSGCITRSRSMRSCKSHAVNRKSRNRKSRKSYSGKRSGTLYVRLVHARGVFGRQGSKPNTFVELECGDECFQSSTIKSNNNPSWNEYFKFYIKDYKTQTLKLRLVDASNERTITKMRLPVYEFVKHSNSQKRNKEYSMNKDCSLNMDVSYENGRPIAHSDESV